MAPYFVNRDHIKEATKHQVTDMEISGVVERTATISSPGGNLPTVLDKDPFMLRGAVGNVNKGLWKVDDAAPTTSEITATKISGADPEEDLNIPPGAQFWHGGRMYAHDGKNIPPVATEIDTEDVLFMDLRIDTEDSGGGGGED